MSNLIGVLNLHKQVFPEQYLKIADHKQVIMDKQIPVIMGHSTQLGMTWKFLRETKHNVLAISYYVLTQDVKNLTIFAVEHGHDVLLWDGKYHIYDVKRAVDELDNNTFAWFDNVSDIYRDFKREYTNTQGLELEIEEQQTARQQLAQLAMTLEACDNQDFYRNMNEIADRFELPKANPFKSIIGMGDEWLKAYEMPIATDQNQYLISQVTVIYYISAGIQPCARFLEDYLQIK